MQAADLFQKGQQLALHEIAEDVLLLWLWVVTFPCRLHVECKVLALSEVMKGFCSFCYCFWKPAATSLFQ